MDTMLSARSAGRKHTCSQNQDVVFWCNFFHSSDDNVRILSETGKKASNEVQDRGCAGFVVVVVELERRKDSAVGVREEILLKQKGCESRLTLLIFKQTSTAWLRNVSNEIRN